MDREMEPPGSNSVWSLIESLRGVKSIGSKLIYKKKSSGNHVWMLMCKSGKGTLQEKSELETEIRDGHLSVSK